MDAFAAVAARFPDRPAVEAGDRVWTYADLAALVAGVARDLGPEPGTVAVKTAHAPATVVALLGILAAGGTYCPLDPGFPTPRQAAMHEAAGWRRMLDGTAPLGDASAAALRPAAAHRAGAPAYTLFTSGSTGAPKPVDTPRTAIAATVASLRELFAIDPRDRVLQFASLSWDTCFEEILPALTSGATLVFDPEAHSGSLHRFVRMVAARRISVLDLPTAFWHELVGHLTEEGTALPPCVRLLIIGGEACRPAKLADWRALDTGDIRLLNTYGCTETTLITHAVDLAGPDAHHEAHGERVPIGRALPHVIERITAEGELLIGGPALSVGYRDLPEATSARFVTYENHRFFRTGDRVHRSPDGLLVHDGRLDHEVKVRGIRVDPAEVEARIAAHPAVGAVAVTGVTTAGRTALVAYIVAAPQAEPDGLGRDILRYLREHVPSHLIPSRVTVVPALVYTASGKVDRAASHAAHGRVKEHSA
jgi:nonribosomal peptide synthetase protein VioO